MVLENNERDKDNKLNRDFKIESDVARQALIREEMASGRWYEAADEGLARDRDKAREVIRRFNCETRISEKERMALLRELFGALGERSSLSPGLQVDYGYNIFIGKRCFFNFNCTFLDGSYISFGDDVWVGPQVVFATAMHPLRADERSMRLEEGRAHLWERNLPITVGSGVWIAGNVSINPGVTIGDGAVIGTGSIVTKDIPAHVLAYGSPCRVIREITDVDSINPH